MSLEESNERLTNSKPLVVKFRKLDIPIVTSKPEDFIISTEQDFDTAAKIAHAYSKGYSQDQPARETFESIGAQIGHDFQFNLDLGGGCDTLAGQLRNSSVENRDCKLPTLLLALAFKELNPNGIADVVFLKSNPAHPYVHITIDGKTFFGHFTPGRNGASQISGFHFLSDERTKELENFISRERVDIFPVNEQGMKAMDELFIMN